jgi:phosphopantothenoylcysteine decarboxylase/phosphopantothenate--cysteine ligase
VTGSIAAIKAPIVARELMRAGAKVSVALTPSAQRFTTPLAMSALTHEEAITEMLPQSTSSESGTWHIKLARSAQAMLIAPCSATTIGKLRAGIYDNAVTLLASALPRETPLIIAPAMDEEMWLQTIVQQNIEALRQAGVLVIDPVSGPLASGIVGHGRMLEPNVLVEQFTQLLSSASSHLPLFGKTVLITGGPTYEPLDPVRFIGNRSSGKMAVALAGVAEQLGANVTLIMGPSPIHTNGNNRRIDIETAEEMRAAVLAEIADADIIIMNAAVSDFSAANESLTKLKKRDITDAEGKLSIELQRTPDILSEIARIKRKDQRVIGFALETGAGAESYAKGKLLEKDLDMIVLNRADETGAGFGGDTNKVTIFSRNGSKNALPLMSKEECAREIFALILLLT